jgi:hypothetical protein
LEYTVSDGNGNTDTAIVTIVVNGANSNPHAEDDSETTYHHSTVSASVWPNDSNPEDDKLAVTSLNGSTDGVDTAVTSTMLPMRPPGMPLFSLRLSVLDFESADSWGEGVAATPSTATPPRGVDMPVAIEMEMELGVGVERNC